MRKACALLAALSWCLALPLAHADGTIVAENQAFVAEVQRRWESSPHGPMLSRILPPRMTPAELPKRQSLGARLTVRYCVQCHQLPNPAMHSADRWPSVVDRMMWRMRGHGNLGKLMEEMMADVAAPTEEERAVLTTYLRKHARKSLDPAAYPDLATRGWAFREACSQCHGLPDPRSHRRSEWPLIVSRMEENMAWMNRVVGSKVVRGEPQLQVQDIVAYLQRHAAPD